MTPSSRVFLLAAFAALAGLVGESLLFLETQCARVAELMTADFRAVVFLKPGVAEERAKVVADQLRALGGVDALRYVPREDALEALRRGDPALVESTALIGENPLPNAIEASFTPDAVGRAAQWTEGAYGLSEVEEVRYRPAQAKAILQAQFYRHFLRLVMDIALVIVALVLAYVLWWHGPAKPEHENLKRAAAAAASAAGGMTMAYLLVWPLKSLYAWWAWPGPGRQLALLAVAAAAAKLFVPAKR
jgi:cell division protein FtsX